MHPTNLNLRQAVWKTYGFWFVVNILAFLVTYPLCNWIATQRLETVGLYFEAELSIPFIPEFIWAYFSVNLLFIFPPFSLNVRQLQLLGRRLLLGTLVASLFFLCFPAHLGFTRVTPMEPLYQVVFSGVFYTDPPHNLFPSLHVVYSSLGVFALASATRQISLKMLWWTWLTLIITSTLLIHQHHLFDVFMGLLLACVLHLGVNRIELARRRQPPN